MSAPSTDLHLRLAALRSRALVRLWEMRQLDRAGGAWHRLARLLAGSQSAWAIGEGEAELLLAEGVSAHPVGFELEPPLRLFLVTGEQLARLSSARQVPLRSSPELIRHRHLVLVPFEETGGRLLRDPQPHSADRVSSRSEKKRAKPLPKRQR